MPAPHITPLPTPPSRSQSPDTFSTDADAFLGALPEFQTDANTQADYLDGLADQVTLDAASANAAAAVATGAANYKGDYSAIATYQIGDSVSYNSYRWVAKTVNTGITPAEGSNWFLINDGDVLGPASATSNALAVYDGGTGKLLKNGPAPGPLGNMLISDGTNWTSGTPGGGSSIEAVASGNLSDGSTVVINADGTVSAITGSAQSVEAPVTFRNAEIINYGSAYDNVNNKIVIVYKDITGGNLGKAVVGTVNGSTITFGTPVAFTSSSVNGASIAYDANAQKFVIAYVEISAGYAIVGTVSGTSISFGTPALISGSSFTGPAIAYNAQAQKVMICWTGVSSYAQAVVGTVSGTSISIGPNYNFRSVNTQNIKLTYDSVNQKNVIAFRDGASSSFGAAIVASISGTVIDFGASATFQRLSTYVNSVVYHEDARKVIIFYKSVELGHVGAAVVCSVYGFGIAFDETKYFGITPYSSADGLISAAYNNNAKSILIAFSDGANSNYGSAVTAFFDNGSIKFGPKITLTSSSVAYLASSYDQNSNKLVISFSNSGLGSVGKSVVFTGASSNLTNENFIGFSDGAYTSGQTAKIQLVGSMNEAQSGLTAGQSYFVQPTGGISLTPSIPSVFAGTAVSANKIIIKG